jgi:hypothetical protein
MVIFEDGNKATITTEDILFEIDNQALPNNYHTTLFFDGLAEGDEIVYRVYLYNVNSGTYTRYWERPVNWNTTNQGKERAIRIPWVPSTNFKVTLQKTLGANSTVRYFLIYTPIP